LFAIIRQWSCPRRTGPRSGDLHLCPRNQVAWQSASGTSRTTATAR